MKSVSNKANNKKHAGKASLRNSVIGDVTEPISSVLYVSRSLIPLNDGNGIVADLVLAAAQANLHLGITGALIYTGSAFVQCIEGPLIAVDTLMAKIKADTRHEDVLILKTATENHRHFEGWSLAYRGISPFVTAMVDRARLSDAAGLSRAVRNLNIFLERFAARPDQLRSSENTRAA